MTTVNVLEVMDQFVAQAEGMAARLDTNQPVHAWANQVKEARAAVAELAATQVETLRMLEAAYLHIGMTFSSNKRVIRAKQALSRIGGGA